MNHATTISRDLRVATVSPTARVVLVATQRGLAWAPKRRHVGWVLALAIATFVAGWLLGRGGFAVGVGGF